MQFVNIHSHEGSSEALVLQNLIIDKQQPPALNHGSYYTAGLHPWYLSAAEANTYLYILEKTLEQPNVLALGEAGLDRACTVNFELQLHVFQKQILLAESMRLPLIIHCVRAYEQLIQLKNQLKPNQPWIVHGFDQNQQILQQLLVHDIGISVGAKALLPSSNAAKACAQVPVHRLFIETDSQPAHTIGAIYQAVASILSLSVEQLKAQQIGNFENIFTKYKNKIN
jgi:TatD DNase family protein